MRHAAPLALAALAASATPALAESQVFDVLQNDSSQGGTPFISTELEAGDIVAARLAVPANSVLMAVEVLFGGAASGTRSITLKVWDDSALTDEPGAELLSSVENVFIDNAFPARIFLSGLPLPDHIRIGIQLHEAPPPMVGQDIDGTIAADKNFTRRSTAQGWVRSSTDGSVGDWIIRAAVANDGGGGGGGGGSGVTCFGVPCPAGQFCDTTARTCTFECTSAEDCGGAFCNSNGQCVGEGAGCCETGGGGGPAAALLGLGVLALVVRGRRHRS